ncbi:hypothetical protein ACIQ1D_19605 [Lysinibacillus xylanilyticus]|uniref:hypothetical protein n=1 Tax=Lysinibacillus xylanilyticus TaxID=582475 RepID=UPI00381CCAE3
MDIDRIISIGTFIVTSLVGLSTILLQRQQRRSLKRGQTKKRPSSLPSGKRKKKARK